MMRYQNLSLPHSDLGNCRFVVRRHGRGRRRRDLAYGLRLDHAVTEDERIDAVVGMGSGGICGSLKQEHVAAVVLFLHVPDRVRQVGEQLPEAIPDSVLAAFDTRWANHHGVIGVIGDDLIKVRGSQNLAVMS